MTTTPPSRDTGNLILFLGTLLGLVLVLMAIALFAFLGLISALGPEPEAAWFTAWTIAGLAVVAASLLPGLYWSGRAAFGMPVPGAGVPGAAWLFGLLIYPGCLAMGALTFANNSTPGLAGAFAFVGTAVVPVGAVAWLARRLGPSLSPTRAWGQFTIGLTAMPLAALAVELVVILPLLVLLGMWLMGSPDGQKILEWLQAGSGSVPDPDLALDLAERLLQSPLAIAAAYGYLALVIPVLEEAIKTMAVWPFLRKGLPPAEAFLGGALGGAGYALFEALFLTQPGEGWFMTTLARSGATLLHVFTAAVTSWGLMEGVRRRRYRTMAVAFAGALTMHAAWNASAVTIGISSIPLDGVVSPSIEGLAAAAPAVLTLLIAVSILGLTLVWKRLPTTSASAGK